MTAHEMTLAGTCAHDTDDVGALLEAGGHVCMTWACVRCDHLELCKVDADLRPSVVVLVQGDDVDHDGPQRLAEDFADYGDLDDPLPLQTAATWTHPVAPFLLGAGCWLVVGFFVRVVWRWIT